MQYGYCIRATHAQVLFPILAHGNMENEENKELDGGGDNIES